MTSITLRLAFALLLIPAALGQSLPELPEDPIGNDAGDPASDGQAPSDPGADAGLPDPGQGPDDNVAWDRGLVWGLGAGGIGLAALAGLAYYLGVGGLRHVDKNNVLEHPMRQSLLEVVETEPGVHLRELAQRHETAVTNTQWHLRKLEMAGLVKTQKVQGRRLYYPTAGGQASKVQAVQNAAMQNPNARRIMDYLVAQPGTNQRSLAEALDMNPGTVRWHLRKMESANMVRCVQDGTQSRYFPTDQSVSGAWSTGKRAAVAVED